MVRMTSALAVATEMGGDKFRNFLGANFMQIRGGTSGAPVAQSTGSQTVIKVKVVPAG